LSPYAFPNHYPLNCPPQPYNEMRGTYYRLVKNENKSDPSHFKSYYEDNKKPELESTKACSRRAVSVFKDIKEAINLSKQFENIGTYVAILNLKGGHGVVCKEKSFSFKTHHNWWVPDGVNAQNFCSEIRGLVS